ncbi:nuclear transport factor 2 family protein [Danxiaibacter flavus]|uniref:Nuclear transport factor 2 family protein n=1 Tax=Danxiaibacter flavus TaxID=3049108 RepID=A0ABV3ZFH6_9BACT|nr:nuclear transport factor 2 family protein [Chitinophagaceae bacterium DXS]
MHKLEIIETIQNIFIGADEKNWKQSRSAFADKVYLDYTSMAGGDPLVLNADQIIESWSSFLPKFKATHHQLGNFMVNVEDEKANAFFYGTATHYFPNTSGKNIWTVVATYNASLVHENDSWKVISLRMNLKYQDGNLDLPKIVQNP